ncbi:alpha-galactosidase, partial [Anoxybacillus geothermalis]|nr:alpha-galactosidase [Anoxybacillus geothermalis]
MARGAFRDRERPILINNWEATYFDFNEEKMVHHQKMYLTFKDKHDSNV